MNLNDFDNPLPFSLMSPRGWHFWREIPWQLLVRLPWHLVQLSRALWEWILKTFHMIFPLVPRTGQDFHSFNKIHYLDIHLCNHEDDISGSEWHSSTAMGSIVREFRKEIHDPCVWGYWEKVDDLLIIKYRHANISTKLLAWLKIVSLIELQSFQSLFLLTNIVAVCSYVVIVYSYKIISSYIPWEALRRTQRAPLRSPYDALIWVVFPACL